MQFRSPFFLTKTFYDTSEKCHWQNHEKFAHCAAGETNRILVCPKIQNAFFFVLEVTFFVIIKFKGKKWRNDLNMSYYLIWLTWDKRYCPSHVSVQTNFRRYFSNDRGEYELDWARCNKNIAKTSFALGHETDSRLTLYTRSSADDQHVIIFTSRSEQRK